MPCMLASRQLDAFKAQAEALFSQPHATAFQTLSPWRRKTTRFRLCCLFRKVRLLRVEEIILVAKPPNHLPTEFRQVLRSKLQNSAEKNSSSAHLSAMHNAANCSFINTSSEWQCLMFLPHFYTGSAQTHQLPPALKQSHCSDPQAVASPRDFDLSSTEIFKLSTCRIFPMLVVGCINADCLQLMQQC